MSGPVSLVALQRPSEGRLDVEGNGVEEAIDEDEEAEDEITEMRKSDELARRKLHLDMEAVHGRSEQDGSGDRQAGKKDAVVVDNISTGKASLEQSPASFQGNRPTVSFDSHTSPARRLRGATEKLIDQLRTTWRSLPSRPKALKRKSTSSADTTADAEGSDEAYIPPKYRWTPILSGLLQPFSILLEIPGLTEHWYVKLDNGVPVTYQDNPTILNLGLGISMTCGAIANVALICRFVERRILASTITCIIALTIHDIINIICVTVFGVIHADNDGFDYSEAFWLCLCSTVASFFTNVTLIYDLFRTKDFRRSGSGLTPKQRSLVIIVMVLLVYIALGALVYNFMLGGATFQNALYFVVVSVETIGFGDIVPPTTGARVFLFFYVPIGILNLAVAVGTARDTLVESWNTAYRRRRHKVLQKHQERKRQREEEEIRRTAIEKQIEAIGHPAYVDAQRDDRRSKTGRRGTLNTAVLSSDQLKAADDAAEKEIIQRSASISVSPTSLLSPVGQWMATSLVSSPINEHPENATEQEKKRSAALAEARRMQHELLQQSMFSEEGYREFQERMQKEEKTENAVKFTFAFSLFAIYWVVGATVFARTEDWTWFTAFYFCFVTFSTIGYGDVTPVSPAGRAFFVIWAMLGVATLTLLLAVLTEAYSSKFRTALVHTGAKSAMSTLTKRLHQPFHRDAVSRSDANGGEARAVEGARLGGASVGERLDSGKIVEKDAESPAAMAESVDRTELSYEILNTVRAWHTHVSIIRQTGLPTSGLTTSEAVDILLKHHLDSQGLSEKEKTELMADPRSKKMVFWAGYERAVHRLLVLAEMNVAGAHAQEAEGRHEARQADNAGREEGAQYMGGQNLARG